MYRNKPLDLYIPGYGNKSWDIQSPSIFHTFLLPRNNDDESKYYWEYARPPNEKIENCVEKHQKCVDCSADKYFYVSGRVGDELGKANILIQTSEDFVIQTEYTILFVKVMICMYVFIWVLKIRIH